MKAGGERQPRRIQTRRTPGRSAPRSRYGSLGLVRSSSCSTSPAAPSPAGSRDSSGSGKVRTAGRSVNSQSAPVARRATHAPSVRTTPLTCGYQASVAIRILMRLHCVGRPTRPRHFAMAPSARIRIAPSRRSTSAVQLSTQSPSLIGNVRRICAHLGRVDVAADHAVDACALASRATASSKAPDVTGPRS